MTQNSSFVFLYGVWELSISLIRLEPLTEQVFRVQTSHFGMFGLNQRQTWGYFAWFDASLGFGDRLEVA